MDILIDGCGSPIAVAMDSLKPAVLGRQSLALGAPRQRQNLRSQRLATRAAEMLDENSEQVLRRDTRGRPIWGALFAGSISHSSSRHAVALARFPALSGVGIDVEERASVSPDVEDLVLTSVERRDYLAMRRACPELPVLAIAFSAKEAVYKAVSPSLTTRLEFDDVILDLRPDTGGFRAVAEINGAPWHLFGRFWAETDVVTTLAWRKESADEC